MWERWGEAYPKYDRWRGASFISGLHGTFAEATNVAISRWKLNRSCDSIGTGAIDLIDHGEGFWIIQNKFVYLIIKGDVHLIFD